MDIVFRVLIFLSFILWAKCATNYSFPEGFRFGTATSSYQIEGAWNESGKGENIWDFLTHNSPELIADGSNGDIACDSYHKYEEDIALLKDLGVDFYRFSLSWTRIFPKGHPYNLNSDGINYYNNLLDGLVASNITPMVTLFHWDLPQTLMELGGLANPYITTYFTEYAKVAFDNFGDRVKYWITFNEPFQICMWGYGDVEMAPVLNMSGIGEYLCGHNLLKAHAAVYHLYNDTYRALFNGTIGITISATWYEPNTTEDEQAAERIRQFHYGIHLNPVFSAEGDYPTVVKEYVANRSALEGYRRSRLPTFTQTEIEYIRGSSDFLGLNHYTTRLATGSPVESLETSYANDKQVYSWYNESWPRDGTNSLAVVPWGFRKLLVWLRDTYNDPLIHITENGCADFGEIDDTIRVSYYGQYLEAVLEAIHEYNVNIQSYAAWSLLDNFEWMDGYVRRFGIHSVNFSDINRPRTPKSSAFFYKYIIGNRTVVDYEVAT